MACVGAWPVMLCVVLLSGVHEDWEHSRVSVPSPFISLGHTWVCTGFGLLMRALEVLVAAVGAPTKAVAAAGATHDLCPSTPLHGAHTQQLATRCGNAAGGCMCAVSVRQRSAKQPQTCNQRAALVPPVCNCLGLPARKASARALTRGISRQGGDTMLQDLKGDAVARGVDDPACLSTRV